MATTDVEVEIEGRRLTLGNLDKVLYPSGFTKAQVIDYMARISPYAVPHLTGRALTFRRYPDGTQVANPIATIEEMPHKQIAEILEIPEGTVAWRVNEARRLLRLRLSGADALNVSTPATTPATVK